MTNEEWKQLKEINEEQFLNIEMRIKEGYKQSRRVNFADGVSVGLYYLGYAIFITLFQNMSVIALSGQRKYKNNWWISLLGFNIFFFLYFGEQWRYNKYYKKAIAAEEVPSFFKEYKEGFDRANLLTNKEIDEFKQTKLYTVDNIMDKKFEPLGMVYGSSVRSKNAFSDMGAGIKSMRGGKIKTYTKLMDETRSEAFSSLIINSTRNYKKFDAIINIRMSTSDVASGASEVLVYGTVIKFK